MRAFIFLLTILFISFQTDIFCAGLTREVRKTLRTARYHDNAGEDKKVMESLNTLEQTLLDAIKTEGSVKNIAEYYYLAALVQEKINDIENTKVYLGVPYDTLVYYNSICKLYDYLNKCDSIETIRGKSNRYDNNSRKKLLFHRHNLLNGGRYYLQNKNNKEAYKIFDLYHCSAKYPLLKSSYQSEGDTLYRKVAYWALLSGYQIRNYNAVIHYAPEALKYGKNKEFIQEYLCRSYQGLGKTIDCVDGLKKGLRLYPNHPYFFTTLISYFSDNKKYSEALLYADKMTEYDPTNITYWYAKVQIYLCLEAYEDCIKSCEKIIELDSTMTAAYYYKGLSLCNMAKHASDLMRETSVKSQRYELLKNKMIEYYTSAEQPLLKVRADKPEEEEAWAPLLYQIYLNLNKGDEFDEMDAIMKAMTTI